MFFCCSSFFFSNAISQSDLLENLRRSIPGKPDIDYPIYRTPPETEFSCQSRATGIKTQNKFKVFLLLIVQINQNPQFYV